MESVTCLKMLCAATQAHEDADTTHMPLVSWHIFRLGYYGGSNIHVAAFLPLVPVSYGKLLNPINHLLLSLPLPILGRRAS